MKHLVLSLAFLTACSTSSPPSMGAGVQSACTATSTQVTCTDDHGTSLCTITPRSCTSKGVAYAAAANDPIWLVNAGSGTCAELEAPLAVDGGGVASSCTRSRDCALVCCGCSKPGWIFASGLCVQGKCADPASACAWAYAEDPAVCGPP